MVKHGFTLYSAARISREEYLGWLHELNAVILPQEGEVYDARLSRDARHVWISLLDEDELDMDMSIRKEDSPEVLAKICQLLGSEPRSAIVLTANNAEGSQILALEFAALCAEHYPCVVLQAAGQAIFSAQDLQQLHDAGMGFDGSTWATARSRSPIWLTRMLEEEKKEEEAHKRERRYEEVYNYGIKLPTEVDRGEHVQADGYDMETWDDGPSPDDIPIL